MGLKAQDWQLGGNVAPPLTLANNYLGSNNTSNIPLRFGTFGIDRFFIQNNTGPTAGFVGVGNSFNTPTSVFHVNSLGYNTGAQFRTDGISTVSNVWSMFTGASAATLAEKSVVLITSRQTSQIQRSLRFIE